MTCSVVDATIHQGATAPYAVKYTVTSTGAPFDLSSTPSALFRVFRENGSEDTWAATTSGNTTTSVILTRVLQVGDVPDLEVVKLLPEITTPSGVFIAASKLIQVIAKRDI